MDRRDCPRDTVAKSHGLLACLRNLPKLNCVGSLLEPSMPIYRYHATRKSDGAELASGTINDALNAGSQPMKLAIIAGLLHDHPKARGLSYHEISVKMKLQE
jgi:hypothetical protein